MFAPTLRRLAVAIVVLMGIAAGTFGSTVLAATAVVPIVINGGCRVAGDPNSIYMTGTTFVAKNDWDNIEIIFYTSLRGNLPGTYSEHVMLNQLDFTGAYGTNGGYEFSYRTPDNKGLPKGVPVIDWSVMAGVVSQIGSGSFKLGTAECAAPSGNSGSGPGGTTTISPATQVGVQVIVGGILRDQLSGDFSPKAMKETLKGGHLVGLTGSASLKDNNGNPSKAIWSLKRTNYQKPWKGSVRIVDQSMQIASAFGRSLKASRAKDGRITGSADAEVKGDTKSGIATLKFALAAAA